MERLEINGDPVSIKKNKEELSMLQDLIESANFP
jgi:hypothetical protein